MYTVSVVIPTYNREKTIERCISSVVNQTYKPYEIIIVDDGSDDKTVKIIRQNHKGAQAARDLGVLNAAGEFIAFLDSDDEWVADKLEKQIQLVEKHKNSVIYCDCYIVDEAKRKRRYWKLPGGNGNIYKFLLIHPGPMFQGLLVKREWLIEIGMFDEKLVAYQEWESAIRLARKYTFWHMKEPLFLYHMHSGETISKNGIKGIKAYIYIVLKHHKMIIKEHGLKGLNHHFRIIVRMIKNFYAER